MSTARKLRPRWNPFAAAGAPASVSFTIGDETANTINVAMQLKDANGKDLAQRGFVQAYLAQDAAGDAILATPPNTGVAIGTDGLLIPGDGLVDGLLVKGTLAKDAVAEKFKTTTTAVFVIAGKVITKAAATAIVFSAAHVVSASKFGVVLAQVDAAGTVTTKVPLATQAYTSAPLALAALPAADAGKVALGYIAIAAGVAAWTANTDDMTNASDVTTASFNDATEYNSVPRQFGLMSEADGDIDVTISETAARTMYLAIVLPDGTRRVSGAITFV